MRGDLRRNEVGTSKFIPRHLRGIPTTKFLHVCFVWLFFSLFVHGVLQGAPPMGGNNLTSHLQVLQTLYSKRQKHPFLRVATPWGAPRQAPLDFCVFVRCFVVFAPVVLYGIFCGSSICPRLQSQTEIFPVQNWSLPLPDPSTSAGQHFWTHGRTIFILRWARVRAPHRESGIFPVPGLDKNRSPK